MQTTNKRLVLITALAASVVVIAGCASMKVNSYAARGLDMRQYRSYVWGPADTESTGDARLDNNRFFDEQVRKQVDKGLGRRGFEKTASGPADLIVHYHANLTQKVDVREYDRQSSYCEDRDCRPFVYQAGTLFVDLVDSRTNKLMWRGWAEQGVDGVIDDQNWMDAKVAEAVAKILGRLPRRL